jgi:hypothetical protein
MMPESAREGTAQLPPAHLVGASRHDADVDEFEAELWLWSAKEGDSWVFVTVPEDVSDEIRERSGPPRGFGSARVEVTIGTTTWRTSVFPNSQEPGCYALPVKKAVRRSEGLDIGETAVIRLRALDE